MIHLFVRGLAFYILFGAVQNTVQEKSQQSNNKFVSNDSVPNIVEINNIAPSLLERNDNSNIKPSIDLLFKKMNRKMSKKEFNKIKENYNALVKKSKRADDIKKLKAHDVNDEKNTKKDIGRDDATGAEFGSGKKRPPLTLKETQRKSKDFYERISELPERSKTSHRFEHSKYIKKAKFFYIPDSKTNLDEDTNINRRKYQENKRENIDRSETDFKPNAMKRENVEFKSMKARYNEGDKSRNKVFFSEYSTDSTTYYHSNYREEFIETYTKKPWYLKNTELNSKSTSPVDDSLVSKRTYDVYAERLPGDSYRDFGHSSKEAVISSAARKLQTDIMSKTNTRIKALNTLDVTEDNKESSLPKQVEAVDYDDFKDDADSTDRSSDIYRIAKFENNKSKSEAYKKDTVTSSSITADDENHLLPYGPTTNQQQSIRKHPVKKDKNSIRNHKQPFNFDPFAKKEHRMKYLIDQITPDVPFEVMDTTETAETAYNATLPIYNRKNVLNFKTTKKIKHYKQDDTKNHTESTTIKHTVNIDKNRNYKNAVEARIMKPVKIPVPRTSSVTPKKPKDLTRVHNLQKNISIFKHVSNKSVIKSKSIPIQKAIEKTVIDNVLEKYNVQHLTTISTSVDVDAKKYEKGLGIDLLPTPLQSTSILSDLQVFNYTSQILKNNNTKVVNYGKNQIITIIFTSTVPTTLKKRNSSTMKVTEDEHITSLTTLETTTGKTSSLDLPKNIISANITPFYKKHFTESTTEYDLNVRPPANFKLLDSLKSNNGRTYLPWYKKKDSNASSTYRAIPVKGETPTVRTLITTSVEQMLPIVASTVKNQTSKKKTPLNGGGGNNDDYDDEGDYENEPISTSDLFTPIINEISKNIAIPDTVNIEITKTPEIGVTAKTPVKRYKVKTVTEKILQALLKLNPIPQNEVIPSDLSDRKNYLNEIFSLYKALIRITLEVLLDKSPVNNNGTWYTIIDEDKTPANNATSLDKSDEDINDLIFSESFLKGVFSQENMYAVDRVTSTSKYSYLNSNLGENSDDQTNSNFDDPNTFENEPVFTDPEMHEYKAKSLVETILQIILNKSMNGTSQNTYFLRGNCLKSVSPMYKNIVNTVLNIFNNKTMNTAFSGNKTVPFVRINMTRNKDKHPTIISEKERKFHVSTSSLKGTSLTEVLPLEINNAGNAVIDKVNLTVIPEYTQKTIASDKHSTIYKQSTEAVGNKRADFYESASTTEIVHIVTVSNIDLTNMQNSKVNIQKHRIPVKGKLDTIDKTMVVVTPFKNNFTVTSQNSIALDNTSANKYTTTRTPTFKNNNKKATGIENHGEKSYQINISLLEDIDDKNKPELKAFNAGYSKVKTQENLNLFTQPIEQVHYEEFGKKYNDYEDYEEISSATKVPETGENTEKFNMLLKGGIKNRKTDEGPHFANNNANVNRTDIKTVKRVDNLISPFTEKNEHRVKATQTSVIAKTLLPPYVKQNAASIPANKKVTSFSQRTWSTESNTRKPSSRLSLTTSTVATSDINYSTKLNFLSTQAANKLSKDNRRKSNSDEWIFENIDDNFSTKLLKILPKTALQEISAGNLTNRSDDLKNLAKAVSSKRLSLKDIIDDLDKLNAALVLYNREMMTTVGPNTKGVTPHETLSHQTLTDVKPEDLEEIIYYEMPVTNKEIDNKMSSTPKTFFNETLILTKDMFNAVVKELELMNHLAQAHDMGNDVKSNNSPSHPVKVNPLDPNLEDILRKIISKPRPPEFTSKKPEKVSKFQDGSNESNPKFISIDDKNLEKILQKILLHYTLAKSETTTAMSKTVAPLQKNMTHQVLEKLYNWRKIMNAVTENTRKSQEQACPTIHCFVINSSGKTKPRIRVFKLPEDLEILYPVTSQLNGTEFNKKHNDGSNFPNTPLNGVDNERKLPPSNQKADFKPSEIDAKKVNEIQNQSLMNVLKPLKSFFYKKPSIEEYISNANNNLKPLQEKVKQPTAPWYISVKKCGLDYAPFRNIQEGEDNIETYPWLGVLLYPKGEKRLVTTVILVTVQLVIASAWEINKLPKEDFRYCAKVILGHNCTGPQIGVVNYNYHPDFRAGYYGALAVIQIDTSNMFSKLKPICPPPHLLVEPQLYSIVMPEDCTSSKINIFQMDQVCVDSCKQYYGRSKLDVSRFWPRHPTCAKARRGGVCRWRAGTALVVKQQHRWHLLGFGVSGLGCEAPSRFVDYSMHTRWIELTVERIGQPAITRVAPNKIVFRRAVNQIQRFGPCDKEELYTEIFRDSTGVFKPPGTKRESSRVQYNLTIIKNMDYQCLVFQADNIGDKWLPLPKLEIHRTKGRSTPLGEEPANIYFNVTIEYYDDIQYKVQVFGLKSDRMIPKTSKHDNGIVKNPENYEKFPKDDILQLNSDKNVEYNDGSDNKIQIWNENINPAGEDIRDTDEKAKKLNIDKQLELLDEKARHADDETKNTDSDEKAKPTEQENELKPVREANGRRYIRRKSLDIYKNSYNHNFHRITALRSRRKTMENSNRRRAKARGRRRQSKKDNDVNSKSTRRKARKRQR